VQNSIQIGTVVLFNLHMHTSELTPLFWSFLSSTDQLQPRRPHGLWCKRRGSEQGCAFFGVTKSKNL